MHRTAHPNHASHRIEQISTRARFDVLCDHEPVRDGRVDASGWHVGAVDLRDAAEQLSRLALRGAIFRGTLLPEGFEAEARAQGALVFPAPVPRDAQHALSAALAPLDAGARLPFDPQRSTAYTPQELFAGLCDGGQAPVPGPAPACRYEDTPDAKIYQWYRSVCETPVETGADQPKDAPTAVAAPEAAEPDSHATARHREATLAMAVHDHGMGEALSALLEDGSGGPKRIVGIMGGHAAARGTQDYTDAARLGAALTRAGMTVATGGGPGAMEAGNFGALAAHLPEAFLEKALAELGEVPSFRPSVSAWAHLALAVSVQAEAEAARTKAVLGESLGIPTWFYGHEPPNAFASQIVKYFANSQREAVLLEICTAGIVFLPGAGGTVQEVFQDACENYYAASREKVSPMVLVGRQYWTETLPVWPLLQALATGRDLEQAIFLVDTVEDAVAVLSAKAEEASRA